MRNVVWFHRFRAMCWAVAYPVTVLFNVQDSVSLVWFASAYANSLTDWGAGEAADDSTVLNKIEELSMEIQELSIEIQELRLLILRNET